ncbi:uncharacterized protein MONBRDRAFT_35826 [Monosiga brevicollis MX1]|uniref:TIR domain-containing protein n=1 Tax=Monosiga brevicollis TaxID=81824 RepID=A9US16_MONBE|nr:uncharacterized protein MONBRDRAFT_35826 [Monosiga brevicollis MX1]EDQ91701.1 predicted protein [Monosiga brevicollis MX1]|eukprot:XP_001742987.1 hypothetical protein [Monosiga brevicollis MX1]
MAMCEAGVYDAIKAALETKKSDLTGKAWHLLRQLNATFHEKNDVLHAKALEVVPLAVQLQADSTLIKLMLDCLAKARKGQLFYGAYWRTSAALQCLAALSVADSNKPMLLHAGAGKAAIDILKAKHTAPDAKTEEYAVMLLGNLAFVTDLHKISKSVDKAMASAVEDASVVVVALSADYKDSAACRTEGEMLKADGLRRYAFNLRKPVVPLKTVSDYRPDGWLGAIVGSKLYFEVHEDADKEASVDSLVKEIKRLIKANKDVASKSVEGDDRAQKLQQQLLDAESEIKRLRATARQEPTAVGVVKVEDPSVTCTGVLFQVPDEELPSFDEREVGYTRTRLAPEAVKAWTDSTTSSNGPVTLSVDDEYWVYCINDPKPADADFPIPQSYIDVILSGALEHIPKALAQRYEAKQGA